MNIKKNKILQPYQPSALPLVPAVILMPLWVISLVVPNLIYSGTNFADTLHILKWTATGVPIAVAVLVAGVRLLFYGRERIRVKVDIFAAIWAVILIYCALQPLWVHISSPTAFVLEMVCFAAVWIYYVITVSSFPQWGLRIVLTLASLNAVINTLFAELQLRYMNDLAFLKGTFLEFLTDYSTIILPTPPHYIGNTAQQNMFGLWLAVATLGAVYLFVFDAWKDDPEEHGRKVFFPSICMSLAVVCLKLFVYNKIAVFGFLGGILIIASFVFVKILKGKGHVYFAVFSLLLAGLNYWGLLNSTSRSANLAFFVGVGLMLILSAFKFGKNYILRFCGIAIILVAVFWASLYGQRLGYTIEKIENVIEHAETIGNRRGIWTTSYAMAKEHPQGVGIGQYKWHYIEAQREAFKTITDDWYEWQYTHWAHNEFLQFFCEGGVIGGIMFLIMYLFWFEPAVLGFFRRKTISSCSVWGFCLASLITFCAVFTRPFHRIENMVWIALAFALSNREFFSDLHFRSEFEVLISNFSRKIVAVACILSAIAGTVYISSGIYGNYILRQALSTQNAGLQLYLLNEANKHPIVREEVQRNLGYHYLTLGEQQEDRELLSEGFNILWAHFNREPHSEDISKLLNFSQRYQLEDVLRELVSYFKPGTYHLERRVQKDSSGHNINALLLMNGPGRNEQ